ncbi:MAG: carboxylate-amine ligase [Deltaproteobacteria bacterium]|nr:carboxylate-amine ligase [Deltaproteobacteria bacterium]
MAGDFTIGIEEEFQIIDPKTRELCGVVSELVEAQTEIDQVSIQHELHQSMVEVATGICKDVHEARAEVEANRRTLARIAARANMAIGAASTHPMACWEDQPTSKAERYTQIVLELQDMARATLIFGMHVHVGIQDKDELISVYNQARYFLPHLLALSTSSPFMRGRRTGLHSTRTHMFQRLPRTGIPDRFESYSDFEGFVETLIRTQCIGDHRRLWWDVRPHPTFSTLEFRICDLPTRVDDVITIAALIQAIVVKLVRLHRQNLSFAKHRTEMMSENKWRAARYGVRGQLIDFRKRTEVPFSALASELLEFVDDVVDDLGSRKEAEGIERICSEGTSADKQIQVFEKTGKLEPVVDYILEDTLRGVCN